MILKLTGLRCYNEHQLFIENKEGYSLCTDYLEDLFGVPLERDANYTATLSNKESDGALPLAFKLCGRKKDVVVIRFDDREYEDNDDNDEVFTVALNDLIRESFCLSPDEWITLYATFFKENDE